eukprot:5495980-Prymnesium_polylepis.1
MVLYSFSRVGPRAARLVRVDVGVEDVGEQVVERLHLLARQLEPVPYMYGTPWRPVLLRLVEGVANERLDVGLAALCLEEPLEVAGAGEGVGDHADVVALAAALEDGGHVPDTLLLPRGDAI